MAHCFVFLNSPGNISFDHIGLALSGVVHHALSVQHQNVSWLQTLGDIYLGECFCQTLFTITSIVYKVVLIQNEDHLFKNHWVFE